MQRDALQQARCGVIYEDTASGENMARPELELYRKALQAGGTQIVWWLDRLAYR
ncbi:recombinase family protein [Proteus mirabilis]|uniref:recombinase family protein n=1 Tax=Proteus mirabilis TaxID=584 RepID=UPI001F5ED2BE|nr:recombinase family protein [Proteus mirabilis]